MQAPASLHENSDSWRSLVSAFFDAPIEGPAVVAHLVAKGHDIPVIVCTAVGPRHTPEFDPKLVRAVVRKPFDIEELMSIVNTVSRRE